MNKKIARMLRALADNGLEESRVPAALQKRIRFGNKFAFLFFGLSLLGGIAFLAASLPLFSGRALYPGLGMVTLSMGFLLSIAFAHYRAYAVARFWLLTLLNAGVFLAAKTLGEETGVGLLFFFNLVLPWVVFGGMERVWRALGAGLAFGGLLLLTAFPNPLSTPPELSETTLMLSRYTAAAATALLVFLALSALNNADEQVEKRLRKSLEAARGVQRELVDAQRIMAFEAAENAEHLRELERQYVELEIRVRAAELNADNAAKESDRQESELDKLRSENKGLRQALSARQKAAEQQEISVMKKDVRLFLKKERATRANGTLSLPPKDNQTNIDDRLEMLRQSAEAARPSIRQLREHLAGAFVISESSGDLADDFIWWAERAGRVYICCAFAKTAGLPLSVASSIELERFISRQNAADPGAALARLAEGRYAPERAAMLALDFERGAFEFAGLGLGMALSRAGETYYLEGEGPRANAAATQAYGMETGDVFFLYTNLSPFSLTAPYAPASLAELSRELRGTDFRQNEALARALLRAKYAAAPRSADATILCAGV